MARDLAATRAPALALAAAVAALAALACRGEPQTSRAPSPDAQRYTVRGEVVRLPGPGRPELLVRHEAIPGFVDRTGAPVGMAPMTMPFPVERGVALEGVAVGDKVTLRFRMDWQKNDMAIESLEELPATTVLELGPRGEPRP